jgi:hypothetical protein
MNSLYFYFIWLKVAFSSDCLFELQFIHSNQAQTKTFATPNIIFGKESLGSNDGENITLLLKD